MKIITKKSIERHPVPILGIDYKVKIVYSNIKYPQLDVDEKLIKISLPNKHKKSNNEKILDLAINKMYNEIARVEIERAMEKYRMLFGFAPENYEIRKINNDFGRCSNGKIIIDPEVVKYDREFIDYVVLHQYCHLKYKIHCKSFWDMVELYEPKYEYYEKMCKHFLFSIVHFLNLLYNSYIDAGLI